MACSQVTQQDLQKAAQKAFGYLKTQWQGSFSTYWQLGHSFDTIIDYFVLNPPAASGFGTIAVTAYNRSTNNACWYDDYGWWGIAALKASQHPELFPNVSFFKALSDSCWKMMDDNATKVWQNNGNNPAFKVLQPRFDGGVWNCDWTRPNGCGGKGTPPNIPPNCGNGGQGGNLPGIQNTVTNGLYLVLGSRLGHSESALREYDFLSNWFNVSEPDDALLNRFDGGAVVRERVGTYASQSDGSYLCVCGYQSELAWAGDQGIILGGLVDRLNLIGRNNPNYQGILQLAKDIASGVMIKSRSNDGILQAWVTGQGGDPGDYDTGVGAYMRYLLYAYQSNIDMQTYLRSIGYVDFVCANAAYVVPLIDGHQWSAVDLTNDLATVVAALVMSNT
ncbi:MAG TPA: hypothetical protein VJ183_17630 [Chloroflexia bacterium]|nr:hypothetical protein [Chloroflexia bacterium]